MSRLYIRTGTNFFLVDNNDINPNPRPLQHEYWIKHFDIDESLFQLSIPESFDTDIEYNDINEDDDNNMNQNKHNDYVLI